VTPLYPQKLALTSPTGGGRSVGMVRSRTKATENEMTVRTLPVLCNLLLLLLLLLLYIELTSGLRGPDWTDVVQDEDKWQAVLTMAINF
jgi:putative copper export protein